MLKHTGRSFGGLVGPWMTTGLCQCEGSLGRDGRRDRMAAGTERDKPIKEEAERKDGWRRTLKNTELIINQR